MSTASTKSRPKVEKNSPAATDAPADISQRAWVIGSLVVLVIAAFLRFYDLDLVPLHHDEGVNGNFLVRLVRDGVYKYDPQNYHGPTLYYFAAFFPRILRFVFGPNAQNNYGLTTISIRAVTSLFGLGTVALIFPLRRYLGRVGSLSAAAFVAISPGAVYLSRYFIHESLFVFFTLAIVVAALKFYEQGHATYLILAAASAALLFATKETAIISIAVLGIAWATTAIYSALLRPIDRPAPGKKKQSRQPATMGFVDRVGGSGKLAIWSIVALAVFIAVNVLLYSSFFTNYPKGVSDALATFQFWTKTGKEAHVHPFLTYFWWLMLQESPVLVLGAIGAALAVLRLTNRFSLFAAQWAFGLIVAYSLIAYKTPWLCLSFIIPLALTGGSAIQWFFVELGQLQFDMRKRLAAVAVVFIMLTGPLPAVIRTVAQDEFHLPTMVPGYQTLDLNFRNYDNDNRYYVYVYAHTRRETLKLVDEINRIAERTHQGKQTGITIVSPDYWPLPWYFRDYTRVGYYGRMSPSTEPVIIASQGQAEEVNTIFGDRYQLVHSGFNASGSFPLRPGVDLLLYTRRELIR